MNSLIVILKKCSSLKFTCLLLALYLLLLFWGVLGQWTMGIEEGTERFFYSYFILILGVIPVPALNCLNLVTIVHLILSLIFRISKKNISLFFIHFALLSLLSGSLINNIFEKEYIGFQTTDSTSENSFLFFEKNNTAIETKDLSNILKKFNIEDSTFISQKDGFYKLENKGLMQMTENKAVQFYTLTYKPLPFLPYLFSSLFILGFIVHFIFLVKKNRGERR